MIHADWEWVHIIRRVANIAQTACVPLSILATRRQLSGCKTWPGGVSAHTHTCARTHTLKVSVCVLCTFCSRRERCREIHIHKFDRVHAFAGTDTHNRLHNSIRACVVHQIHYTVRQAFTVRRITINSCDLCGFCDCTQRQHGASERRALALRRDIHRAPSASARVCVNIQTRIRYYTRAQSNKLSVSLICRDWNTDKIHRTTTALVRAARVTKRP